ncbi:MAG: glycosyltransferase family 2 protein [Patescibacteria group bacterium]|nr:glycosyltransferase family 2 protein [Patescibacteria group bacterium]
MKLLVLLPAYNEEKTIKSVIKDIPQEIKGIDNIEVLVIDDGSDDATKREALRAGAEVISFLENQGLSLVFQRGVEEALKRKADIMVNIDADGQFNAGDIPYLVKPIIEEKKALVTASRFINKKIIPRMPRLKKGGNFIISRLISLSTKKKFYDVSCGFRAYSREALLNLNLFGRYTYTHETILNLAFKNLLIKEVPIKVKGERDFGQSKIAHNLWRYGYQILNTFFRTLIDYKPLRYFGWTGIIFFILGLIFDIFIFIRLLILGAVFPYKTLGFMGLALNIFGLLLIIVGLVADMINKVRRTQEKIIYFEKIKHYQRNNTVKKDQS